MIFFLIYTDHEGNNTASTFDRSLARWENGRVIRIPDKAAGEVVRPTVHSDVTIPHRVGLCPPFRAARCAAREILARGVSKKRRDDAVTWERGSRSTAINFNIYLIFPSIGPSRSLEFSESATTLRRWVPPY